MIYTMLVIINSKRDLKQFKVTKITLEAGQQGVLGRTPKGSSTSHTFWKNDYYIGRIIPSMYCSRIQLKLSAQPTGVYITPAQNDQSRKYQRFSDGRLLREGHPQLLKSGDVFTVFEHPSSEFQSFICISEDRDTSPASKSEK